MDTGDVEGLAQAVLKVMQDPQKALLMGQAAQERVAQHFSLAQEAAGIGRVYQQLFDQATARG